MAQQDVEFTFQGALEGHSNWVTSIVTGHPTKESDSSSLLISAGRDKKVIIWRLSAQIEDGNVGQPWKSLQGHSHFISDLALAPDNQHVVSSSWDKTLRIWNVPTATCTKTIGGHDKEVFTVAYQPEEKQILSSGADKAINISNTQGSNRAKTEHNNHQDWVSKLVISTSNMTNLSSYTASVGWDGFLKVWNKNFSLVYSFKAHEANINGLSVSANGKYIATGGKDKFLRIWDVVDMKVATREFDAGATINALAFNPVHQWIAVGTENSVKIYNLMQGETKQVKPMATFGPKYEDAETDKNKAVPARKECLSLAWQADGQTLFAGFSDGKIRCWKAVAQNA